MKFLPVLSVVVASSSLGAVSAAALDGEVLISQEKALAGGITPGDLPGFPITITKPGAYKLTGDLTAPINADGIHVKSADVTLNFNGFALTSSHAPPFSYKIGILAEARGLTVRDGAVHGRFRAGIYVIGDMTIIENMRIYDNYTGIYAEPTKAVATRIVNSTISHSSFRGVECGWACHIEGNTFFLNDLYGSVHLRGAGMVLGNTIVQGSGYGIYAHNKGAHATTWYVGVGNNTVMGNPVQIDGNVRYLTPNACAPEPCP